MATLRRAQNLQFFTFESLTTILRNFRKTPQTHHPKPLHSILLKTGTNHDTFLTNNLISLYSQLGLINHAHQLFEEMPAKNVVSWTTVIASYTRFGKPHKALEVFNQMVSCGEQAPNGHTLAAALKACAMVGDLEVGRWIVGWVFRLDLGNDVVLMNACLDMYVKCGNLNEARRLFEGIQDANCASWNIMICGYVEMGRMDEAEELFGQMWEPDVVTYNTIISGFSQLGISKALEYVRSMLNKGIRLDRFTFPCALKTCSNLGFEGVGRTIHCTVVKSGLDFDPLVGSALIDMYAKCGVMKEARELYDNYKRQGDPDFDMLAVSNSMVSGFTGNGYNSAALGLISEMHSSGLALDTFTLSSALKVCVTLRELRIGLQLHSLVFVCGYRLDCVVGSVLIDLYLKCGNFEKALVVFHSLSEKDMVTWSEMITGCVQYGLNSSAFSLFKDMLGSDIGVDHFILSSVHKSCSCLAASFSGKQVHAQTIKRGFEMESTITTSLIDMYSKCGEIDDSLSVFTAASEKDTLCWTATIVGCGQNGRTKEAIECFEKMLKSGIRPNEITFLGVLSACRHAGLAEPACSYFNSMRDEHNLMPWLEHYSCMVDILGRAGLVKEAWQLITGMPYVPDESIWNSFVAACGVHNNSDINKLVVEHLNSAVSRDSSIFLTMSNIYASLGMWDASIKLRETIRRLGMKEAGMSWTEVRN